MIIATIIVVLAMMGIFITIYCNRDTYIVRYNKGEEFYIKPSYELTKGLSVITLYQGSKGYNFLLDTGSNNNHISSDCGLQCAVSDREVSTYGLGTEGISSKVGQLTMYHNSNKYEFIVLIGTCDNVLERLKRNTGIEIVGVLGSDFLTKYNKVLDYKNLIVHTAK